MQHPPAAAEDAVRASDRELLELAAKAARYIVEASPTGNMLISEPGKGMRLWAPLTDDGDALRLSVKLALTVRVLFHETEVFDPDDECLASVLFARPDQSYAATRRAIVLAAARIGRRMP